MPNTTDICLLHRELIKLKVIMNMIPLRIELNENALHYGLTHNAIRLQFERKGNETNT